MAKNAHLKIGDRKATLELFDDLALQTTDGILRLLPLDVPMCHAKFAGDEVMFMIPAVFEAEYLKDSLEMGDVLYYPIQQTICLFFGDDIVPFSSGPFPFIGKIAQGFNELHEAAEQIHKEGFNWIRFVGEEDSPGNRMPSASAFCSDIAEERNRIWFKEPDEIVNLRSLYKGRGGNMTARLYAFTDGYRNQRNLWMLRNIAKDAGTEEAKKIAAPFLEEMADRFEIWEFGTASGLFERAGSRLESIDRPEDIVTLLDELLIYNNRLWLWIDAAIPWFDLDDKLKSD